MAWHGAAAVVGRLDPALRHAATIGSTETICDVAIDGNVQHRGMVLFKPAPTPEDIEAARPGMIKRACSNKAQGEAQPGC